MTKVENASPPAPSADTLRKLDHSLLWEPGSAKTVLYGGEPTSNDSTIPFERRDARLAKAFAAESKIVELLLDLAIEADEVDHSASLLDTNVDDTEGAEQLASDVDSLLIDIDRLTQRIHDEALQAVGGDLVELRARKAKVINERRQRRLGRTQQIELPPPLELADAARQEPDPKEDPS